MKELVPGLWHWTAWHPRIEARVHSYYYEPAAMLIDPMLAREGLAWFRRRGKIPRRAALTNRLHYRHCAEYRSAFGIEVLCHRAGLHEFQRNHGVTGFAHGDRLAGGVRAVKVGALCPEETALALPGGAVALGDSVVRHGKSLSFVPDEYMGERPEAVKQGLRAALAGVCRRPWKHLLLAHGAPIVDTGRQALRKFLDL